jgi:hypothetical protein
MQALVGKVIVEVGRALGKAFIAGVGLEVARVAGMHLRKNLGPKDKDDDERDDKDKVREENERLKAEVTKLKEELAQRKPAS